MNIEIVLTPTTGPIDEPLHGFVAACLRENASPSAHSCAIRATFYGGRT